MSTLIPKTYGDIKEICFNRAKIAADVQERDSVLIESAINEYYMRISTERSWNWRTFPRSFVFEQAVTTGTSSVTNGSREVTLAGITVDNTYIGKSMRFANDKEVYRIIGKNIPDNKVYLESNYVGTTDTDATHKIYKYEFALPPDLDTLDQVFIETGGLRINDAPGGDLDDLNPEEFNQLFAVANDYVGPPCAYTRDGDTPFEDAPPLDVMVLDYDFLAGPIWTRVSKIRLFPLSPSASTVIHLNYTRLVEPLVSDDQIPLMPIDDRWILVHYTLGEWWKTQGSGSMADREFAIGDKMLAEMRQEFHKTDVKPRIVVDSRRYKRQHFMDDRRLLHWISRQAETGGA